MRTHTLLRLVPAAAPLCLAGAAHAEPLRLMTGPQGGVWVPLGGSLKRRSARTS